MQQIVYNANADHLLRQFAVQFKQLQMHIRGHFTETIRQQLIVKVNRILSRHKHYHFALRRPVHWLPVKNQHIFIKSNHCYWDSFK